MDTHRHAHRAAAPRSGRVPAADAEAALVEHYARLVRIAYLTLPASLGPHRRVLLAHRITQGSLPRGRTVRGTGGRGGDPAYALLRVAVLRGALAYGRRWTGWRGRVRTALAVAPLPPQVLGLRLSPCPGEIRESSPVLALAGLDAPARAAYALAGVERLTQDEVARLLADAGVAAPHRAVRDAAAAASAADLKMLASGEFDPCVLEVRPTDLADRRRRMRAGAAGAAVALALAAALLGAPGHDTAPVGSAGPAAGQRAALEAALDPGAVLRAAPDDWLRTARPGFAVWPARGGRTGDRALIGRALAAWGHPGPGLRVMATAGTARTPPISPPRLLFAGDLDGAAVVLLHDGLRLVRYAEVPNGGGPPVLDLARVDAADGGSAAAVVLDRTGGGARYLTAPWTAGVRKRDLLAPTAASRPLHGSADGVTDPVPSPPAGGCGTTPPAGTSGAGWPAVELLPRAPLADREPVLLTDLGDLTPVVLGHASGPGARPDDATGPDALAAWAHLACRLAVLRGEGVRAVGAWQFADQWLPDGGGTARWLCTRADRWSGDDHVLVGFLPPGPADAAAAVTAAARSTAACGAPAPAVLTGVLWKSPAGHWYLLAAGSPEVTSVTVSGSLHRTVGARTLALPATAGTRATLTARLADGGSVAELR